MAFTSYDDRGHYPQRAKDEKGYLRPMQKEGDSKQCEKNRKTQTIELPPIGLVHDRILTRLINHGNDFLQTANMVIFHVHWNTSTTSRRWNLRKVSAKKLRFLLEIGFR